MYVVYVHACVQVDWCAETKVRHQMFYYCLCHSLETGLFTDFRAKLASERPLNLPISTHDHAQLCVYLLGIRTQIFMFANKALLASEPSPQYLILFFV